MFQSQSALLVRMNWRGAHGQYLRGHAFYMRDVHVYYIGRWYENLALRDTDEEGNGIWPGHAVVYNHRAERLPHVLRDVVVFDWVNVQACMWF